MEGEDLDLLACLLEKAPLPFLGVSVVGVIQEDEVLVVVLLEVLCSYAAAGPVVDVDVGVLRMEVAMGHGDQTSGHG